MNDHQGIRVHLRQNIMVGHGQEARYTKVITGIRQHGLDERLTSGEQLVAITVRGYVTGGINNFHVEPVEPHVHLLTSSNILSIEDMVLARDAHCEACPPRETECRQIKTQPCTMREYHAAHEYHDPRAMISCPGFPDN